MSVTDSAEAAAAEKSDGTWRDDPAMVEAWEDYQRRLRDNDPYTDLETTGDLQRRIDGLRAKR